MSLAIVLTLSVLIVFTVFGVAFAYVVFLASEKEDSSARELQALSELDEPAVHS